MQPIVKTPEKWRRITYRRWLDPLNKLQDMNQQFCWGAWGHSCLHQGLQPGADWELISRTVDHDHGISGDGLMLLIKGLVQNTEVCLHAAEPIPPSSNTYDLCSVSLSQIQPIMIIFRLCKWMKRMYAFKTDTGYMTIWEYTQENNRVNTLKAISLTMPEMIQAFV